MQSCLPDLDPRLVSSVHRLSTENTPWHRAAGGVHHGTMQRYAHVGAGPRHDSAAMHPVSVWCSAQAAEPRSDHAVYRTSDREERLGVPFVPDPLGFGIR